MTGDDVEVEVEIDIAKETREEVEVGIEIGRDTVISETEKRKVEGREAKSALQRVRVAGIADLLQHHPHQKTKEVKEASQLAKGELVKMKNLQIMLMLHPMWKE